MTPTPATAAPPAASTMRTTPATTHAAVPPRTIATTPPTAPPKANAAHIQSVAGVTQVTRSDPVAGRDSITSMNTSASGSSIRPATGSGGTGRGGTAVKRLGIVAI